MKKQTAALALLMLCLGLLAGCAGNAPQGELSEVTVDKTTFAGQMYTDMAEWLPEYNARIKACSKGETVEGETLTYPEVFPAPEEVLPIKAEDVILAWKTEFSSYDQSLKQYIFLIFPIDENHIFTFTPHHNADYDNDDPPYGIRDFGLILLNADLSQADDRGSTYISIEEDLRGLLENEWQVDGWYGGEKWAPLSQVPASSEAPAQPEVVYHDTAREMYEQEGDVWTAQVSTRIESYRDDSFTPLSNHHPAYPADFPSVATLPTITSTADFFIVWADMDLGDGVPVQSAHILVPIDENHCILLESSEYYAADGTVSYGFGNTGYRLMNADMSQYPNWAETLSYWVSSDSLADYLSEFDGWYGGENWLPARS